MKDGRILIVESDLILAWDLEELLGGAGYETWTARTVAEGLRSAACFQPHLAIADAGSPGSSGSVDVAALQMGVQGPVILLTCSHWVPVTQSIPGAPLKIVRKPFLMSELLSKVENALDVRRSLPILSEGQSHEVEALVECI